MKINEQYGKLQCWGAGASADAGAPIIGDFFKKAEEITNSSNLSHEESKRFKEVLSEREKLLPNSNIEEFFNYVDFQTRSYILRTPSKDCREFHRSFFNKSIPNSVHIPDASIENSADAFVKLRKDTAFLIGRTLDESLKEVKSEVWRAYQKILNTYDVIISFNWDLLCEHSYQKLNGENLLDTPGRRMGFGNILVKPALLKMHGSFNWVFCKKCEFVYLSDLKIEHKLHSEGKLCDNCGEHLLAVSILPTLNKFETIINTRGVPYENMWHNAYYAITEAEEIHFFGYSLSDADAHAKIFFKAGITQNTSPNLNVEVIYKPPNKKEGNIALENRFIDVCKPKVKPRFSEHSFLEYFQE
ncbi:Uncharacterised protein [uncultured archaeon]|nr:Uncharacterised protein [uncultured archaeon]